MCGEVSEPRTGFLSPIEFVNLRIQPSITLDATGFHEVLRLFEVENDDFVVRERTQPTRECPGEVFQAANTSNSRNPRYSHF